MEGFYYLGFSAFPGIGPVKFNKLLEEFGSAKNAWENKGLEIEKIIGERIYKKFEVFRNKFDLEGYARSLKRKEINYLCLGSKNYSLLLSKITNPPFVLYTKGNINILNDKKSIGIVGTRKITDYGREVTRKLTYELSVQDFVIVSGLAFGVDSAAHTAALDSKGKTVAVLGSGVDICTPIEHQKLYDRILENNGCIVSTVVPGERPNKGSFPARNRYIAGLSQGILVTEGAADSGSLITADYAKNSGRPVFAIPGPITSDVSKGTNNLIKNGAIAISDSGEILDRLGIIKTQIKSQNGRVKSLRGENKEEQKILNLLKINPLHFDEIVRRMKKDSKEVGSLLSLMELKGMVKSNSEGKYTINL